MKRGFVLASIAFMSCGLWQLGGAQSQEVELGYKMWLPPRLQACGPLSVFEEIEVRSGGRLKFVERGGIKTGPGKQYEQVLAGEVDIGWDSLTSSNERLPLANLVGLPYIAPDSATLTKAFHSLTGGQLAEEFAGTQIIAAHTNGFYQIHASKAVETLEDLHGLRVRVPGPVFASALSIMGGVPVHIHPNDGKAKIAADELDAMAIDWGGLFGTGIIDVTSHTFEIGLMTAPFALVMNGDSYLNLPEDLRSLIDQAATLEASLRLNGCFDPDGGSAAKAKAIEQGHIAVSLTDEDRTKAESLLAPFVEAHISELEANGVPAQSFLATLEEAIKVAR